MYNRKRREFESVEPFDIIWAKRDVAENEIFNDEKGYEGSYLVVGRDIDKLYCIRGGHKIKDYYNPYIVFSRLTKNKYDEEKIIYYVNIDIKVIDYDKFINIKTRLNREEKKDLISDLKRQRYLNDSECYDIDLSIGTRDLIMYYNKYYLVIYKYQGKIHCLEISDKRDLENSIYINNLENINYKDVKILNQKDNIRFINKVDFNFFYSIFNRYKEENYEFINYLTKKRNMQIGLFLEFNDNKYYVCDLDEDNLYCYTVDFCEEEDYDLIINNKMIKINTNNVDVIKIKDDFKPIYLANNIEQEKINSFNKQKKLLK